jgi:hypothetical protein
METILNLLWLIVTLVAIGLWRFRWLLSRQNPRDRVFLETVAMVCALALLFPVISLTDDLHPEIVAVDASSGKRNSCLMVAGATRTPRMTPISPAHSALAVLRPLFEHVELSVAGIVFSAEDLHPFLFCGSCLGRSPPSLL